MAIELRMPRPKAKHVDPLRHDPELLTAALLDHSLLADCEALKLAERHSRELAEKYAEARGRLSYAERQVAACRDVARLGPLRAEVGRLQAECDALEQQCLESARLIDGAPDLERKVRAHYERAWPGLVEPFKAKSAALSELLDEAATLVEAMEADRSALDHWTDRFGAGARNRRFQRPLPRLAQLLTGRDDATGRTAVDTWRAEWKARGWL
jgi:hypothetical protein